MLRVGSCFSGIGGLDLGLEAAGGFETAWFIESAPHCQKVLRRHWPDVPVFGDIHEVDADDLPPVDMIAGGYPCQPFSVAGARKGEDDARHLWPEMRRLVRLLRPQLVLIENVPGHLVLGFDSVLCDLAALGYDAAWRLVSAADVGAPHLRKRLFVVAYAKSEPQRESADEAHAVAGGGGARSKPCRRNQRTADELADRDGAELRKPPGGVPASAGADEGEAREQRIRPDALDGCPGGGAGRGAGVADADNAGRIKQCRAVAIHPQRKRTRAGGVSECQSGEAGDAIGAEEAEPPLGRGPDGLPGRLGVHRWPAPPGHEQHDWEPPRTCEGEPGRVAELKGLGNAVVPQVACWIGQRILERLHEEMNP